MWRSRSGLAPSRRRAGLTRSAVHVRTTPSKLVVTTAAVRAEPRAVDEVRVRREVCDQLVRCGVRRRGVRLAWRGEDELVVGPVSPSASKCSPTCSPAPSWRQRELRLARLEVVDLRRAVLLAHEDGLRVRADDPVARVKRGKLLRGLLVARPVVRGRIAADDSSYEVSCAPCKSFGRTYRRGAFGEFGEHLAVVRVDDLHAILMDDERFAVGRDRHLRPRSWARRELFALACRSPRRKAARPRLQGQRPAVGTQRQRRACSRSVSSCAPAARASAPAPVPACDEKKKNDETDALSSPLARFPPRTSECTREPLERRSAH